MHHGKAGLGRTKVMVLLALALGVGAHPTKAQTASELSRSDQATSEAAKKEVIVLSPFTVTTSSEDGYIVDQANTGTIIAVPREQIPFATSVITEALIADLRLDNPADIAQYVAGVSSNTNPYIADEGGQNGLGYRVRGFPSQPLYNGFQTGERILSTNNLGRVEISKGPNAVLYGQAPAGGLINFVPKAPQFRHHGEVSLSLGNSSHRKASFDAGTHVATQNIGKAAFRIGGGHLEGKRTEYFFENEVRDLAGAVTWRINDRITIEAQAEAISLDISPSRTLAFVSLGSGPNRVVDPFNRSRKDRNFTYSGPHSFQERENVIATVYATVKLADTLTFRAGNLYSYQKLRNKVLGGMYGLSVSETISGAGYGGRDDFTDTKGLKLDLLHEGAVAGFTVRSLLGYEKHDKYNDEFGLGSTQKFTVTIPFSRPAQVADYPALPPDSTFTVLETDRKSDLQWTNVRFTQFIVPSSERGSVMWGIARGEGEAVVRDNRNGSRGSSGGDDVTYTVGGTYRLFQSDAAKMILFGNYSTSFEIQSGNQQDPAIFQGFSTVDALRAFVATVPPRPMEPQVGEGFEVGARFHLFKDKLGISVLYFDQTNQNIARGFFVRESAVAGVTSENLIAVFQLAGGEENAKGVEISAAWNPTKNLLLTLGGQFAQGRVVANREAPEEVGFGLVSSPENMLHALVRYEFDDQGPLSGLSCALGASYNSSTRVLPQINDRYRVSDDYTNVRAMLRYRFKAFGARHSLSLNAENLTDEEYTNENNVLSQPLSWKVALTTRW